MSGPNDQAERTLRVLAAAAAVWLVSCAPPAPPRPAAPAAPAAPAVAAAPAPATACPWVGSTAPIATRVARVMSAMTLDEKIALVHGARGSSYVGYVPAIPRLCIPALNLEDGPAGVADGMTGVTQLPAPVALAASWDTALARRYGAVVGEEEWGKGANVNLGPTVNIVRDPRWGRAFEAYGEDPYLSGRIGVGYIRGVQGAGVLAQVKHWVAYNQETYRNTPADDVAVDRRTLHEIYMPQFEAAIEEAGASSVMCAYSTIDGAYACEDAFTQDTVLKGHWRFPGFITSDWGATHSTVASALNGLDMEMPGSRYFGDTLRVAVQAGRVPESRLDDMVRRVLTQEFRFHLFDRRQTGDSASVVTNDQHAAVARRVAEEGTVLLKNEGGLLPLSPRAVHSIAVIGPDAGEYALSGGGGSAAVVAPYVVTPFQGIARRAGRGVEVRYAQGALPPNGELPPVPSRYLTPDSGGGRGLAARFYDNTTLSGSPVTTRVDSTVGFNWHHRPPVPGVGAEHWSARWTGTLTPPATGEYTFGLTSDDGSRLFVDGVQVIDNWRNQGPTLETGKITLTSGQPVRIEVDYYQAGGGDTVSLGWLVPGGPSLMDQAVALADSSDVAVVFAGAFESEGADLANIDLPGEQNVLIRAVADANPHTIVVLNTGSADTMPWIDSVAAVLEAWYPGQEDGNAIARVLFGDVNPSGKLPVTFPRSLADVPASSPARWPGVDGRVAYSEGLEVGYRWYDARHITPLFPFGFGLSYTTFRFSNLRVSQAAGGTVMVTADVANTGERPGADVVQVYVGQPSSAGEPPWQLKAFRKVQLGPGETWHLTFTLDATAFAHWDAGTSGWLVDAGEYRIGLGDSSADLPLRGRVTLSQ
ncbi:MAG: glycoside hydrolase family 3 C-terminal domain-containing protein [Gemmatimonadota bacterium]